MLVLTARPVDADGACTQLAYTFQPDCYHPAGSATCKQTLEHLDLGPQIAVWLETVDHTLVETLMVTNLTAARGIGNRPGIWNFRSGPKFPYGKRWMSLPLWAHARGKLYDSAMMQDDREDWMGFHEAHSSREPYFCRPLMQQEVNLAVDAVTCPSQNFNSAKGKLDATKKSYYPPRNDLGNFVSQDCDIPGESITTCTASAATYAMLNDLDAVAAATPQYGTPYTRTWHIPATLPAGQYAVVVEINKEYDTNAFHSHVGFDDEHGGLSAYGIDGNLGQPSVLYRVPVHLGGASPTVSSVSQIAGYSKWAGDAPIDGTLLPLDNTISTTVPGSGAMRLLEIDGPAGKGRVHVELQRCGNVMCDAVDGGGCPDAQAGDGGGSEGGQSDRAPVTNPCDPLPPAPERVDSLDATSTDGTSASITFVNASANGTAVEAYDIRYRQGTTMNDDEFEQATHVSIVNPAAPGTPSSFIVSDLKPGTQYALGVRSVDQCQQRSRLAVVPFATTVQKFKQLSGCFVATAAFGSELEPHVAALRRARDRLGARSPVFAAATAVYYRSGPAAAALVGRSEVARAMARRVLGPFAGLAEALDTVLATSSPGR